jgi:prepilin-type N-terminal cleavage/methylation domain-containing protein
MSNRGFTLIELSLSLGILSVLATGAFLLISLEVDSSRQSETMAKVLMFKRAIVGDSRIVSKESRTDFGYVGDMGNLPNSLEDLWIKGSQPAFVYDDATKAGAGWAGPYVQLGVIEFASQLPLDAWGNAIQYVVQTGTSSVTGQE